jgi:pilus assembly protein CpaF
MRGRVPAILERRRRLFGKFKSTPTAVKPAPAPAAPLDGGKAAAATVPAAHSAQAREKRINRERMDQFYEMKNRIHRTLVDKLDLSRISDQANDETREQVREIVAELCDKEQAVLNFSERQRLISEIIDETFGLGPLEVLLSDPTISDILVNGPHQVYIQFKDNAHLMHIIDKIVSAIGRRCDEVSPMVDARLADGSRVNAIIPPLAIDGPSLSIRRFGRDPITWDDYVRFNSCPQEMIEFFRACVSSSLNVLVVGGTGSGKTTLLNNLSSFIPAEERIVTIEDAAELKLRQPHVVRLESRPPNIEGKGRISIRELLINALRMRPDRIVVGECRGAETLDMLQAMNTGHDGSMTTIHANNTRDAIQRIETMVMMAGFELPVKAIRTQFATAINLVLQASRLTGGPRKIVSVTEVTGMEGDVITMQDIFKFEQMGVNDKGRAYGRFVATGLRPSFLDRLQTAGCEIDMSLFEGRVLAVDEEES